MKTIKTDLTLSSPHKLLNPSLDRHCHLIKFSFLLKRKVNKVVSVLVDGGGSSKTLCNLGHSLAASQEFPLNAAEEME